MAAFGKEILCGQTRARNFHTGTESILARQADMCPRGGLRSRLFFLTRSKRCPPLLERKGNPYLSNGTYEHEHETEVRELIRTGVLLIHQADLRLKNAPSVVVAVVEVVLVGSGNIELIFENSQAQQFGIIPLGALLDSKMFLVLWVFPLLLLDASRSLILSKNSSSTFDYLQFLSVRIEHLYYSPIIFGGFKPSASVSFLLIALFMVAVLQSILLT